MTLNPEAQLALNDQAVRNDWSQEQIDKATSAQELTQTGQEELAHVEEQQTRNDRELQTGLAITALTPEQQMSVDTLAASGADQERIDKVAAQYAASNQKTSV